MTNIAILSPLHTAQTGTRPPSHLGGRLAAALVVAEGVPEEAVVVVAWSGR